MEKAFNSIKSWALEDRPREKLTAQGKSNLTKAELLAIIIGSGSKNQSAVELCKEIVSDYDGNLKKIGRLGIHELTKYKGIGTAKAISVIAALELGKRRLAEKEEQIPQITTSQDAYKILKPRLFDLEREEFWALYLNRSNRVVMSKRIGQGGISSVLVDQRIIFRHALECSASSIILAHNHPSNNLNPSRVDREITSKIFQAGKFMEIAVLDHIIICASGYYSFADEGELV